MTHVGGSTRLDHHLCYDTRGMGLNVRDGALLWLFTAWFGVVALAMSGAVGYAVGCAVPATAASAFALGRHVRRRASQG